MKIARLAVNRPVSILLIIIALVVFGFSTILGFDLGYMPEMNMPMLGVITVYNGANPDVVDEMVTTPVEEIGTVIEGYDGGFSTTEEGLSVVLYQFEYGKDIDDIYMDVKIALDKLDLPDGTMEPMLITADMNDTAVLRIIINGEDGNGVLDFADNTVVPALENLTSISSVEVSGGAEFYVSVTLDETKLEQYGVSMNSIQADIASVDFNIPANSVDQGNQTINLTSSSSIENIKELTQVRIKTAQGSQIFLTDVAEITLKVQDPTSISRYNGNDNVSLGLIANQSVSPVTAAKEAKKVLEEIEEDYPEYDIEIEYDESDEILSSLFSVGRTLLLGIFLAMLVLFLFFGDLKASLIVGSSMPVSFLITLLVMGMFNFELNLMTSTALLIAIGMMVDNSIVVIDSCFHSRAGGLSFKEAAVEGCKIVGKSVVASTITTVVVYFPIAIIDGFIGEMFRSLGFTIIFAMVASLITAVALIPLCFSVFKPIEKEKAPMTKAIQWLSAYYKRTIPNLLKRKGTVVLVAVGLLIGSFALVTQIPLSFMPDFGEGTIQINTTFRPGTRIDVMDESIEGIENDVKKDENVENYSVMINSDGAIVNVYLKDNAKITKEEYVDNANDKYSSVLGMDIETKIGSSSPFADSKSSLNVILESNNYEELMAAVKDMENFVSEIDTVSKVKLASGEPKTKADIEIDSTKAMYYNISPVSVAAMIRGLNTQQEVMTLKDGSSEQSVMLEYEDASYDDFNSIMQMQIPTMTGSKVSLSEIATLKYTDETQIISKQAGKYSETIEIWATPKSQEDIQSQVEQHMQSSSVYKGIDFGDDFATKMMGTEMPKLVIAILTAIFLVFLVMGIQFESPRLSLMVMLSVVFSFIGAFGLMFISGEELNTIAMMGVLMLVGIVVNNGILFVDTANHLRDRFSIEQAVVESGSMRLRPILMTTLTTILSMVPLSLGIGAEDLKSMGLVIIGGLVASTVLILILLPTFYVMIMNGKDINKAEPKEKREKKSLEMRLLDNKKKRYAKKIQKIKDKDNKNS